MTLLLQDLLLLLLLLLQELLLLQLLQLQLLLDLQLHLPLLLLEQTVVPVRRHRRRRGGLHCHLRRRWTLKLQLQRHGRRRGRRRSGLQPGLQHLLPLLLLSGGEGRAAAPPLPLRRRWEGPVLKTSPSGAGRRSGTLVDLAALPPTTVSYCNQIIVLVRNLWLFHFPVALGLPSVMDIVVHLSM